MTDEVGSLIYVWAAAFGSAGRHETPKANDPFVTCTVTGTTSDGRVKVAPRSGGMAPATVHRKHTRSWK